MRPPGRVPPSPHRPVPGGPVRAAEDPRSRLPAASRGLLTGPRAHALLRTARQIKNVSPFQKRECTRGGRREPGAGKRARTGRPALPRTLRAPAPRAPPPRQLHGTADPPGPRPRPHGAHASREGSRRRAGLAPLAGAHAPSKAALLYAAVTATPAAARKPGSRGTSLRCSSAKDQGAWLGSSSLNTPRAGHGPPRGSTGDTTTWRTRGKGKDDAQ